MTATVSTPASPAPSAAQPALQVVPIDPARWPAAPREPVSAHYRWVTLDLDTGVLRIYADPRHCGPSVDQLRRGELPRELQGRWRHSDGFPVPVPRRMVWFLSPYGHLDSREATALLDLIAEYARILLAGQVEVPERSAPGYDWSRASASAVRTINSIAHDPQRALREPYEVERYSASGILDLQDAFALAPGLADPEHAAATDAELDDAAERLVRWLPTEHTDRPELQRAAGVADSGFGPRMLSAVGVLAALYRYRRVQAGTLTVCQAAAWFASRPGRLAVVRDDTPDAELARLAHAEDQAAAAAGHRLVGALDYLMTSRAAQRDHLRNRVRSARHDRAALVLRIDAWGDPADGGDTTRTATLAALAGVTENAVAALRERAHLTNLA